MPVDVKKRNARQYAWQKENKDRINLIVPKGVKVELQIMANEEKTTVMEIINRAIARELGRPYLYGMRLRGFSPGCQPKDGLKDAYPDPGGKYHDILMYDRRLTDDECRDFELDYIGRGEA